MNKLWSLFYGEKEYYNKDINVFSQGLHDTDKFNVLNDFFFDDTKQITNFIRWLKKHNFKIYWFSGLGYQFDHETFSIKTPKKGTLATNIFCFIIMFIFLVLTLSFGKYAGLSGDLLFIQYFNVYGLTIALFFGIYASFISIFSIRKAKITKQKMRQAYLKKIKP